MKISHNPIFQVSWYTFLKVLALGVSYFLLGTLPIFILNMTTSEVSINLVYLISCSCYIPFILFLKKKWSINLKDYFQFSFKWQQLFFVLLITITAVIIDIMVIDSINDWTSLIAGKINTFKVVFNWDMLYIVKFFYSVISAPLFEEVFFRGLILTFLLRKFSAPKSILISAFLFSIAHLRYDVLSLFFWGILLGYIFYKTKSLWISYISHLSVNFMSLHIEYEKVSIEMLNYRDTLLLVSAILCFVGLLIKQNYFFPTNKKCEINI